MLFIQEYQNELEEYVCENKSLFQTFQRQKILITGAAGLIGSYIADLFITANKLLHTETTVYAIDKNESLLHERFGEDSDHTVISAALDVNYDTIPFQSPDYVIHAASNTSPLDYALQPVSTIQTNVIGTDRLLRFSVEQKIKKFVFCSSVEAYGRNNGDIDEFDETYSGYVDCNSLRAGYPSSKRAGEALCNAYYEEHPELSFVIARIGRIYGPTVIPGDAKAPSQFIENAVNGKDIILKSRGTQEFSYGYVGDCAIALLTLIQKGKTGEAYNIADPKSRIRLYDFAGSAAKAGGSQIIFQTPSATETAGYSKIDKAVMSTSKITSLGWQAKYHTDEGIARTVRILQKQRGTTK